MTQDAPIADDATAPDNAPVPEETSAPAEAPTEQASTAELAEVEQIAGEAAAQNGAAENDAASGVDPQMLRLLEAVLFAAAEPMDEATLATRLPEGTDVHALLAELSATHVNRGVNLVQAGGKWMFRTAEDLAPMMRVYATQARKLSRAAIETMAIVAYHQPITRAEMEEIRGVGLSKGTLDMLFEQGWITPRGRRQTPGKPVTWGTTERFLVDFGIESLEALPGVDELKAAGLLDKRPAIQITDAMAPEADGEAAAAEEEARLDDESLLASMASDLDREPPAGEANGETDELSADKEPNGDDEDDDDESGEGFNGDSDDNEDDSDDDDDEEDDESDEDDLDDDENDSDDDDSGGGESDDESDEDDDESDDDESDDDDDLDDEEEDDDEEDSDDKPPRQ